MANQKNQTIKVPLNGGLNFSKNKTAVTQWNGFNDLNSPIYGDMLSPFYAADRKEDSPGSARPYLTEDGKIMDKDGNLLLDVSTDKGVKRTVLDNRGADVLAVYDENAYVSIERNDENFYTSLNKGDIELGENTSTPLPFRAVAAAYTESGYIIVLEKGYIHIYDAETFDEVGSKPCLRKDALNLTTFYDPLTKWQMISVYEPFGEWESRHVSSYTEKTKEWIAWDAEREAKQIALNEAIENAGTLKTEYEKLYNKQNTLKSDLKAKEDYMNTCKNNCDYYRKRANKFIIWNFVGWAINDAKSNDWWWKYLDAIGPKNHAEEALNDWNAATNKTYPSMSNAQALEWTRTQKDEIEKPVIQLDSELKALQGVEPKKYIDPAEVTSENPNYFTGKVDRTYNYILDTNTGSLTEIKIDIPWKDLSQATTGPSGDSYIFAGIYDSYFSTNESGQYILNSNADYVRYKLAVVPHKFVIGDSDTNLDKYCFALCYTPKIYFRKGQPPSAAGWSISTNIKDETPLYIYNKKGSLEAYDAQSCFAGSGTNNRPTVWGKVNFIQQESEALQEARKALSIAEDTVTFKSTKRDEAEDVYSKAKAVWEQNQTEENLKAMNEAKAALDTAKEELQTAKEEKDKKAEEVKNLEKKELNFNKFNTFFDMGFSRYSYYSPWSQDSTKHRGNATINATAKEIDKINFNYEVSGDGLLWETPTEGGKLLMPKKYKGLFREIIINGALQNIAVTENIQSVGTLVETTASIDENVPLFYPRGREGNRVIYKSKQGKWIILDITDKVEDIHMLNEDYVIVNTVSQANCIDLRTKAIKHFANDWNNRFSLVGSPYIMDIRPLKFDSIDVEEGGVNIGDISFTSGININFEITQDPIVGASFNSMRITSNSDNITPIGFVSKYDNIEWYYVDKERFPTGVDKYVFSTIARDNLAYNLFNDIRIVDLEPSALITLIPGLLCKIKPSNFGRFYLADDNDFYSLVMYNGKLYYTYYVESLLDDIKELFMVQGQTFAISKSDYLYSVYVDQNSMSNLADAVANVKGLQYCGANPEMAIFYSPMERTLKSFTADHVVRTINQATEISDVYYTTYNPQTSSIYICTNNGVYVYAEGNQYRLPIFSVIEIYFGGDNDRHTYIKYYGESETEEFGPKMIKDYIFDKGQLTEDVSIYSDDYKVEPINFITRYYGPGNNQVSVTDCVYFRLYSDEAPLNAKITIKESSITDASYDSNEKTIDINKKDWDKDTKTCYVRYQPKNQRSVGLSLKVTTDCAISEINFSNSPIDTVAISKPKMNG